MPQEGGTCGSPRQAGILSTYPPASFLAMKDFTKIDFHPKVQNQNQETVILSLPSNLLMEFSNPVFEEDAEKLTQNQPEEEKGRDAKLTANGFAQQVQEEASKKFKPDCKFSWLCVTVLSLLLLLLLALLVGILVTYLCGGELGGPGGTFSSPNYPNPYPHNALCYWHIQVKLGMVIQLKIETMDVEASELCFYDWLEIYKESDNLSLWDRSTSFTSELDKSNAEKHILYEISLQGEVGVVDSSLILCLCGDFCRYCGTVAPATINTNSNQIVVGFVSDDNVAPSGFTARYRAILPSESKFQLFPDYISQSISKKKGAKKRYISRTAMAIIATSSEVDWICSEPLILFIPENCSWDEFFCDQGLCLFPAFVCDGHQDCLDNRDEANCSAKHTGCGGTLTSLEGQFFSPNYPKPYPHLQICLWHISVPVDHVIQLQFYNFSLESHKDCNFDFVEVYDSAAMGAGSLMGRFCNSNPPPVLTSSQHVMTILFVADEEIVDDGFFAVYRAHNLSESRNGECVAQEFVCDSWRNCPDGSDEVNCTSISSTSVAEAACEPIKIEMCQGLSYNSTSFPNIWLMIPHQQNAEELLQDYMVRLRAVRPSLFQVLRDLRCYPFLRLLICSLVVPKCIPGGGTLQPCRSVCLGAEEHCRNPLAHLDILWPLNCNILPDSANPLKCFLP
ncbi:membrane frizzled-related protein [Thamnophis elegans]|uniref:membrane frizzled-related protein n=1 Tax=Thamnophis elegans TaxID=35005 RepID=UPI001376F2C6|nr:membrane frizzled-related protein [Thamnophis elegans]